jgi:two-component system nitrogen regulation sensor histidine kinase GlnL
MRPAQYAGLDLLATAVMVLDAELRVRYLNPAAEQLLSVSRRNITGLPVGECIVDSGDFRRKLARALAESRGYVDQDLQIGCVGGQDTLHLSCIVTPVDAGEAQLVVELRPQLRIEREAQRISQAEASRELIRNLAHEIKNPLGGLRGSAQLLERELARPELREYTQVIIKEADRLQLLMDRLLTPHHPARLSAVNIHDVCERVSSLILAEFPAGIRIVRDYDVSLPEFKGDREQLIQAVLNVVRNAAQAIASEPAPSRKGQIELKTCVARQVTLANTGHKLALELRVTDNGPGIPVKIRDKIFNPLVSGREGGSGLGLTLAQNYVQHHGGVIELETQPGRTSFRILLPMQ